MSIPRINVPRTPDSEPELNPLIAASANEAVFQVKKKRVSVNRRKIAGIVRGLAEVAYSMGKTNNIDGFTEQMTDDILAGFQIAAKRRAEKRNNPSK